MCRPLRVGIHETLNGMPTTLNGVPFHSTSPLDVQQTAHGMCLLL